MRPQTGLEHSKKKMHWGTLVLTNGMPPALRTRATIWRRKVSTPAHRERGGHAAGPRRARTTSGRRRGASAGQPPREGRDQHQIDGNARGAHARLNGQRARATTPATNFASRQRALFQPPSLVVARRTALSSFHFRGPLLHPRRTIARRVHGARSARGARRRKRATYRRVLRARPLGARRVAHRGVVALDVV